MRPIVQLSSALVLRFARAATPSDQDRVVAEARARPTTQRTQVKAARVLGGDLSKRALGEGWMTFLLRHGTVGVALAVLFGQVAAQSVAGNARVDPVKGAVAPAAQLRLTPEQKVAIVGAIRPTEGKVKAPDNVPAVVGAEVPPTTELYFLPDDALVSAPEAKGIKYTVARNRVVLVDPTRMRVVEVIPP
jgi:hypothetical protein